MNDYRTRQEAADHLGVALRTIDRMLKDRRLTGYKIPGRKPLLISVDELDALRIPVPVSRDE